jgi:hypothetical protein
MGVKKIAPQYSVDIEVENTHTYQLANGVVTHNTVSLLAGAVPGCHFPISRFYIRRVRLMNESELLAPLREAGYHIEPCIGSEKTTVVVEFPTCVGENIRTQNEVSMWEKLELASFLQEHWSDNSVSVTVDFDKNTEGAMVKPALDYYQYRLKCVSFLPRLESGTPYPQQPYEEITEAEYLERKSKLRPLVFQSYRKSTNEEELDKYCDGDKCEYVPKGGKDGGKDGDSAESTPDTN